MPDDSSEVLQFPLVRERQARKVRAKLGIPDQASPVADRVVEDAARTQEREEHRRIQDRVRSREAKGYGPTRVIAELEEQGVDAELIAECVKEGDQHWIEVAMQYVSKRYARDLSYVQHASDRGEQVKVRNRIARNLHSRGFHSETIAKTLKRLLV